MDCVRVRLSPIDVLAIQSELGSHPSPEFVEYLVNGLQGGFAPLMTEIPQTTVECTNNRSATSDPTVVSDAVEAEVAKGYVIGGFQKPPYPVYRINPLGVATGKYSGKKRLILDLSAPHNTDNTPSINDLISKESASLSYVTIDNAIAIIKQLGQGAKMCKVDITDAFKQIPLHPNYWPFFGFRWDGECYFYTRLAFGCRSSPKIFDALSQAVCWILQCNHGVQNILHLLDDFLTIDPPEYDARITMKTVLGLFEDLNIPLAVHKTVGPVTSIEYLGIILDSENMTARLPDNKLSRISEALSSLANRNKCTKRELLSLLGHLNYACRVVVPGRSFFVILDSTVVLSYQVEPPYQAI